MEISTDPGGVERSTPPGSGPDFCFGIPQVFTYGYSRSSLSGNKA